MCGWCTDGKAHSCCVPYLHLLLHTHRLRSVHVFITYFPLDVNLGLFFLIKIVEMPGGPAEAGNGWSARWRAPPLTGKG